MQIKPTIPLKPSDAREAIIACIKRRVMFNLRGNPGTGKTELIYDICKELGIGVYTFILSQHDAADLTGVPFVDRTGASPITRYASPSFFADLPPNSLFFADEVNRGSVQTQNAFLQLSTEYRIGDAVLPPGATVGAAMNPSGTGTGKIVQALGRRATHLDYVADRLEWCQWAAKHIGTRIDPVTMAFFQSGFSLDSNGEDCFDIYDEKEDTSPCPRQWEKASRLTSEVLDKKTQGINFSANAFRAQIQGTVGTAASLKYLAYIELQASLPSIPSVLMNPSSAIVPKEPSALYAVAAALAVSASPNNFGQIVTYYDRLPKEYAVMGVKNAIAKEKTLESTAAFTTWFANNTESFV